ncbi:hypothetical protein [Bacillus thuringiensis]
MSHDANQNNETTFTVYPIQDTNSRTLQDNKKQLQFTFVETTAPQNTIATSDENPDIRFPVSAVCDGVISLSNYWWSNAPSASLKLIFPQPLNLVGIKLISGNETPFTQRYRIKVEKYLSNGSFEPLNGNGVDITIPTNTSAQPTDYILFTPGTYEMLRISYSNVGQNGVLPIHEIIFLQQ